MTSWNTVNLYVSQTVSPLQILKIPSLYKLNLIFPNPANLFYWPPLTAAGWHLRHMSKVTLVTQRPGAAAPSCRRWGGGKGNLYVVWPVKCFSMTNAINMLTRCWWMGLEAQRTTHVHYINGGAKGSQAAFPKSWRKFGAGSGTETNFLQTQFCALTVGSHQKNWVSSHKQPLGVGSASHNT